MIPFSPPVEIFITATVTSEMRDLLDWKMDGWIQLERKKIPTAHAAMLESCRQTKNNALLNDLYQK